MKLKSIIPVLILALTTACGKDNSDNKHTDTDDSDYADWIPSTAMIIADLSGHSLTEGVVDGYHKPDWTFNIEYGNVSDLKVEEVLTKTDSKYLVIVDMKLSKGGNYYYQTKARINYIKSPEDDSPIFDYVTSLGMSIVADDEFKNDITCELVDDGWGGVYCLQLRNKSEISLAVGGQVMVKNQWTKFSTVVAPNGTATVGGTFSGGSVTDYRIDFIVRDL